MPRWGICAFGLILMFLGSCRPVIKQDARIEFHEAPPAAEALIRLINQKNEAMPFLKCLGKICRVDGDQVQTSRAAWAAAPDGRLRMEFLGLPGQAAARLIFDGKSLYVESPAEDRVYRKSGVDPDLGTVAGVSVGIREVIACLAGGVPIYQHDTVLLDSAAGEHHQVLVLKGSWRGVIQKIGFNGLAVESVEVWKWGSLVYRAAFMDHRMVEGRLIPFCLEMFNADYRGLTFQVDRCWPVGGMPPEIFQIPTAP